MLSSEQTQSFAGTWGKETKLKLALPGKQTDAYCTTSQASFSADKFSLFTSESNNKFAKFVSKLNCSCYNFLYILITSIYFTANNAAKWLCCDGFSAEQTVARR
jgi:hypothetical protein